MNLLRPKVEIFRLRTPVNIFLYMIRLRNLHSRRVIWLFAGVALYLIKIYTPTLEAPIIFRLSQMICHFTIKTQPKLQPLRTRRENNS
jgi:hypothetical protein